MVTHAVGRFSGGEKARLTLALIVRQRPNLLLLDEPTNHLDIEMREALAEALQDYDGALVVVAHDRHLLRATTDALWLVADGAVVPFDGDLDDYREWVLARSRRAAETSEPAASTNRKAQKRAEAQMRQREYTKRKPLVDRRTRLEREMSALGAESKAIEDWLASPDAYIDAAKDTLKERLARKGDLTWQLARLEAEWLEVSEALDKLDA
jgi:ATP-binding cassette subfamily F protein 3